MPPVLQLESIQKHYWVSGKKLEVIKGISLNIEKGTINAVVGKSGSGKSTLLNMISGLTAPSKGQIFIHGKKLIYFGDIITARYRNRLMGFIFQTFRLLPKESVYSNIILPAQIRGQVNSNTHQRVISLCEKFGIINTLKTPACLLSGGQKQRVSLVRALINNPEIILADEPTANLDTQTGKQIFEYLIELKEQGKTIILVTHSDEYLTYMNTVYRITNGYLEQTQ